MYATDDAGRRLYVSEHAAPRFAAALGALREALAGIRLDVDLPTDVPGFGHAEDLLASRELVRRHVAAAAATSDLLQEWRTQVDDLAHSIPGLLEQLAVADHEQAQAIAATVDPAEM